MIYKLYGKYFQKSRSFLYPALGIKRTSSKIPSGTYLSLEGRVGAEEMKLICSFVHDESAEFLAFEEQMLTSNPLFVEKLCAIEYNLYIFDLEIYKADWYNFIQGKYSKLSSHLKRAIKSYYGENSSEYLYIETYLYPEKYFEIYAKLLDVKVSILIKGGELCNPCDIEKENLKISIKELESLTKI
jgi:hypothetical protein